jgi:hypothetical protein
MYAEPGNTMSKDGMIYPKMTENGSMARSYGDIRRSLLEFLVGNGLEIGDVRR